MKKYLVGAASGLLLISVTTLAFANHALPKNVVPLTTVIKNLEVAGYQTIHEVEFDDGMYKAEVFDQQGQKLKLHINPKTGSINQKAASRPRISMLDAIKTAEQAGYEQFYEIELEHNHYEIKAHKNGEAMKIIVDAQTGEITHSEQDD